LYFFYQYCVIEGFLLPLYPTKDYIRTMRFRVKELAKSRGVTMESLAQSLGYTRQNLTKTLSNNPTIGTLEKIADALDVEITELFAPDTETRIICPHCGNIIKIKAVK